MQPGRDAFHLHHFLFLLPQRIWVPPAGARDPLLPPPPDQGASIGGMLSELNAVQFRRLALVAVGRIGVAMTSCAGRLRFSSGQLNSPARYTRSRECRCLRPAHQQIGLDA